MNANKNFGGELQNNSISLESLLKFLSDANLIVNNDNFSSKQVHLPGENHFKIENRSKKLMEDAKNFLSSNLNENINIHYFCKKKGISYANFRLKFKKYSGLSPNQYRIKQKMLIATEYLKYSDMPIKKLAAKLGYTTPYEFSNYFKRYHGLAPIKYRKDFLKQTEFL